MDTLDRAWQSTESLLGHELGIETRLDTAKRTKGSFSPASGFALVTSTSDEVTLELKSHGYPALFSLPVSHLNPIKTRNLAPTRNWNSRFPPLFSAKIPNITAKKGQIPHPAKPIGDPQVRQVFSQSASDELDWSLWRRRVGMAGKYWSKFIW